MLMSKEMLADYGMTWNDAKGEWVGGNDRSKVMSALAGKIDKMNSTTLAISQKKGGLITEQEKGIFRRILQVLHPTERHISGRRHCRRERCENGWLWW